MGDHFWPGEIRQMWARNKYESTHAMKHDKIRLKWSHEVEFIIHVRERGRNYGRIKMEYDNEAC